MRELHLFDIGSFVHAGAVNTHSYIDGEPIKDADGYRCTHYQTGGIALILNKLAGIDMKATCLFCADRNPTVKKEMIRGYKSNRKHNITIEKQKKIIEIILENIGYDVLYKDGYEADDLIYSCVRKFKKDYDHIYIYTGDSDLYFLVDDTVSICASSSKAKDVTVDTYSSTKIGGVYMPYNTITYNKILAGDKSDCIPGLPDSCLSALNDITSNELLYPYMGDKDFVMGLVSNACPEAVKQVENVFPIEVEIADEYVPHNDMALMKEWGGLVKANRFTRIEKPKSEKVMQGMEELCLEHLYDEYDY